LCDNRRVLGVSCGEYRRNGAFAEFVNVPSHIVFSVPDEVTFEQAAMVEPVSVAVHAVNITPITLGDTAVVVGAGMIGLLTLQAARTAGCAKVISVDLADDRLALAKKLGADETINSGSTDVVAAVRAMTEGRGADVVFEAVGATPTVKMAIESTRKGGVVTLIGNIAPTIDFGLQSVVTREISVLGSCASSNDYAACLKLIGSGAIRVDDMISATVPLARGAEMFDRLYAKEANLTKVILQP
jgi:L-iditol 2-dehydrogenase